MDNNQPGDSGDDILCTYGYDTLSRKIEEACQIGSNPVRVTSYNFDESLSRAGDLDPISMTYPDGREVEYHYDAINRLNQINDANHSSIVAYDYIGRTPRVLQKSYQNGILKTMEYDGIRRPTQLLTAFSQQPIIGFEHDYDKEDNKLNERKLHDSINSELYVYDSAYRLTTFDRGTLNTGSTAIATPTTTTGALQLRDWTLDGVGNWSTNNSQNVGADLLVANRQNTNFNEIADETGDVPSTTFDHDNNGNQITNGEFDYQWDALNRLRSVTSTLDGAITASYSYDCQNRRMQKQTSNPQPSTTNYYYSGWRVCEEYDFDGTNETLKYQYVWGATYHDELITRDDRTTASTILQLNDNTGLDRQFQHHNTLFSIFAVTDEAGNVLECYQYDPYGNITIFSATFDLRPSTQIFQEFTNTGQRFDIETGLYYYKNRFYSPNQGRFISRDPIGYEDGMHLYQYGHSNPLFYLDPTGTTSVHAALMKAIASGNVAEVKLILEVSGHCLSSKAKKQAIAFLVKQAFKSATKATVAQLEKAWGKKAIHKVKDEMKKEFGKKLGKNTNFDVYIDKIGNVFLKGNKDGKIIDTGTKLLDWAL